MDTRTIKASIDSIWPAGLTAVIVLFAAAPARAGGPASQPVAKQGESTAAAGVVDPYPEVKDFEADGVKVKLLEIRRTGGDTLNVRWQYVNTTDQKKQLTDKRTGWIDPYRLCVDAYILDNASRTKYWLMTDMERRPIAARHGGQNSYIFLGPRQTLKTWAKFQAPPASVEKVTVSIPGTDPWENVPILK